MIHAVRCPQVVFHLTRAGLRGEHFQHLHRYQHLGIIWSTLTAHITLHGQMMTRLELEAGCTGRVGVIDGSSQMLQAEIVRFLNTAFGVVESELAPDVLLASGAIQRVVDQLVLQPQARQLSSITDPNALSQAFAEAQQAYERTRVVANTRSDIWAPENREKYLYQGPPEKTHIDWIDKAIGGIYDGSLCGLLAESGGGKTMAGIQMVCEKAIWKTHVCGFYYEQSVMGDLATRIISRGAGLARDVTTKTYREFTDEERAKIDRVTPQMQQYMHLFDMSGSVRGQGQGCVQEIEMNIKQLVDEGKPPRFAVIDWLGPMVVGAYNLPEHADAKDLRQKIDVTLNALKRVTAKYGVTIFVLHQIAPHIIEGKSPAYKPDWTVAQECKNFGQLMHYVFTFGKRDGNMRMWCNVPKARGAAVTCRIVQMDPLSNQIVDVNDKFFFNVGSGNDVFVPKGRGAGLGSFDDDIREGLA